MEKELLEQTIALRHALHQHPELSMKEQDTMVRLMEFLKAEERLTVVPCGKWFYAYYECTGAECTGATKTIAFRADMDALPINEDWDLPYASVHAGVSHRCGHDGHSAVLAGLAMQVARCGANCNIYFIFQHAEEIGAGGIVCAELIKEKNIEEVYAFHNWSGFPAKSIVLKSDIVQCASKGLLIRMIGQSAHASQPEDGVNPTNALSHLALFISEVQQEACYQGMVLATIVGMKIGDKNFGIAASKGELYVTLRSYYDADLHLMQEKIVNQARKLAKDAGLDVELEEEDVFPDTVNDATLTNKVEKAAKDLLMQVVDMKEPFRSSEDFGYYQKKCPGVMIYIGNGENYPQIHTVSYDFNDMIIETAVDLFYAIAND